MTNVSLVYHFLSIAILGSAFLGGAFLRSRRYWKRAAMLLVFSALLLFFLDAKLFNEGQRMFMAGFHAVWFLVFALTGSGLSALVRYIAKEWDDRR